MNLKVLVFVLLSCFGQKVLGQDTSKFKKDSQILQGDPLVHPLEMMSPEKYIDNPVPLGHTTIKISVPKGGIYVFNPYDQSIKIVLADENQSKSVVEVPGHGKVKINNKKYRTIIATSQSNYCEGQMRPDSLYDLIFDKQKGSYCLVPSTYLKYKR